jgi:hypothetical protein
MTNTTNSTKALLTCLLLSFFAYTACNKSESPVNTKNLASYAKTTGGATVILDSTIHQDSVFVDSVATLDSTCYNQSLKNQTFKIYAKFTGQVPPYVWVNMAYVWYGPIPVAAGFPNNTYLYENAWFDQIGTSQWGLGCLSMKFTYSTTFASTPSISTSVCVCK